MTFTTHGYHIPGSDRSDESSWNPDAPECGGVPDCQQCTYEAGLFVNGEYDDLSRVQAGEAQKLRRDRRLGRTGRTDPLRLRQRGSAPSGGDTAVGSYSECVTCHHSLLSHMVGGKCTECTWGMCMGTRSVNLTRHVGTGSLVVSPPVDTPSVPLDISLWRGHVKLTGKAKWARRWKIFLSM